MSNNAIMTTEINNKIDIQISNNNNSKSPKRNSITSLKGNQNINNQYVI